MTILRNVIGKILGDPDRYAACRLASAAQMVSACRYLGEQSLADLRAKNKCFVWDQFQRRVAGTVCKT